jgi:hypothetical protein
MKYAAETGSGAIIIEGGGTQKHKDRMEIA